MITIKGALYITSGALEAAALLLIALKTYRQPKKIRYILMLFGMINLPASIINIISYFQFVDSHWNVFAYIMSTLFMLAQHFWLNLDIGKHLRIINGILWKHPLVLIGTFALAGSIICLVTEIIILLIRNDPYPVDGAFITGVCLSILCDGTTYLYSFSPLIYLKKNRHYENQSRITSIGVWYLLIQMIWYILFGILYIWFFCQTWESFTVLLVVDYSLRIILCLMFTWAPPNFIIEIMKANLFPELPSKQEIDSDNENRCEIDNLSAFTIVRFNENEEIKKIGLEY
ncbi:MAG: hypothetical protein EXX96DRAFT_572017 [Benjaminiella poitrasii]|nr:MAG: hypothetical protein EXX96DRAFT_572017 [Benjaminiella poitrasii]